VDAAPGSSARYSPTTVDHFQHPRNVGRLPDADALGYVDDAATETTISIYLKVAGGVVDRATFRTFGCSACVAASSMATVVIAGRPLADASALSADALDAALGGLPGDKRFCVELAAEAVRRAVAQLAGRRER
jgi:nitrogen fixation protein NifU and related proteins